jgi:hypothetical protein
LTVKGVCSAMGCIFYLKPVAASDRKRRPPFFLFVLIVLLRILYTTDNHNEIMWTFPVFPK